MAEYHWQQTQNGGALNTMNLDLRKSHQAENAGLRLDGEGNTVHEKIRRNSPDGELPGTLQE